MKNFLLRVCLELQSSNFRFCNLFNYLKLQVHMRFSVFIAETNVQCSHRQQCQRTLFLILFCYPNICSCICCIKYAVFRAYLCLSVCVCHFVPLPAPCSSSLRMRFRNWTRSVCIQFCPGYCTAPPCLLLLCLCLITIIISLLSYYYHYYLLLYYLCGCA